MKHRFSEEGLQDLQDLGPGARGLVRHVGREGGSAGSVLRSQGTCPSDAFALRAMRDRMFRFQCSLQPSPLPPGVSHGDTERKVGQLNRNRGGTHALSCLGIDPVR